MTADGGADSAAAAPDDENAARTPGVVLVGPPGAGKSTIGRKLARELGVDLYDTDAGIEERTGRTIPEIFAEDGEPEFRRIEEEVVRDAVLAGHGVVSLGGGSVLSAATRELLRDHTVVYLEISVGEGLRRTGASTNRPLLNGDDPARKYRELMKIRRPLYRDVASVRVRTDGRSPGRVVRMILAKLGLESVVRPEDSPVETSVVAEPSTGSSRTRNRRRRRRGRGRGDGQTTTTADTTATEADSDSDRPGTETAAGTETTKRARRGRRSRRSGRRPADAAASTTTTPAAAPAAASTAPTEPVAPGSNSGRRRRASRSAGAPTNSSAPEAVSTSSPASSPSGSGAQQDSPNSPGLTATPGNGRSRRARARRARARVRGEHTADQSTPAEPARTESEQQA